MKKMNKFLALLVVIAMMTALCVTAALADDPAANTADFAVTKLLKVPTGTAIPADTEVTVVFNLTEINSVAATAAQNETYDKEKELVLTAANAKVTDTTTKAGTTYYYYSTENLLSYLGLTDAPAGVYKYEISEKDYKVGGMAYNALPEGQNATIENGGTYTLTVAKTIDGTYSITASQGDEKVKVEDYDPNDNTSVTGNGLELINTYYEESGSTDFASSKMKVTKDVQGDGGLYTPGDGFAMTVTVTLPDIAATNAEGYVRHYNYNAESGTPTDTPVDLSTGNISLAKGDVFYLIGAPKGTLVTAVETDSRASAETNAAMYQKSGEQTTGLAVTDTAQTITIVNTYQSTTVEGVLMDNLPFIILALLAIGGMGAYIVIRRRNGEEA